MEEDRTIAAPAPTRLELRGITKAYPGCLANDCVDLTVLPGERHALLGENGAGKSTLVKIVYGVVRADSGQIFWESEPVDIQNPAHARRLGIGMVFQHFNLFDTLTVAENIALGLEGGYALRALEREIATVSERYGLKTNPRQHVHSLSVGERQRVEIIRCLLQDPKLLIMDEPTSVLTPNEVDGLFETLVRLSEEGRSILYISHKLEEIKKLCVSATVLRQGRVTANCDPRKETARSLAEMMIGREMPTFAREARPKLGEPYLVVQGLTRKADDPHGTDLIDISLEARGGQILGIAGVAGNGQRELIMHLSGERRTDKQNVIRIGGKDAGRLGPAERRALGLAFVPEERLGRGAVPEMSLRDNTLLTGFLNGFVRNGLIRFGEAQRQAERVCKDFDVVCSGADAQARSLSGGNLQKFIMGREITQAPRLLLLAQPTWGVDVGAAAAIRQAILDLRNRGTAVVVFSEDLDELFEISDVIAVIAGGRLSAPTPVEETDMEKIGLWMGGAGAPSRAAEAEGAGHTDVS